VLRTPALSGVSRDVSDDAWALTGVLSPRASVRTANVDAYGRVLNDYSGRGTRTTAPVPGTPWAMYLAGTDGRYRFAVFDLDIKTVDAETIDRHTRTITGLLELAGIRSVTTQSGPAGGRHVWVAMTESVDAETVADLARTVQRFAPSLDRAPLSNPATGCVRPPGAPHRDGGRSTVIAGTLLTLTAPSTSPAQLRAFTIAAAQYAAETVPDPVQDKGRPLPKDRFGHLYLPGAKRPLPAGSQAALAEDAASGDASSVLWRVLTGAAAAHWRYQDVAELQQQPGLEHIRTLRTGSTRTRRPTTGEQSPATRLAHQWRRAVRHVASTPRSGQDDPTFDLRAGRIAALVQQLQERADASPGRWSTGGGPADRRALDALCELVLQAVTATVEVDQRRLGELCGFSHTTAGNALRRLTEDGWIQAAIPAAGTRATHWLIDPQNAIHRNTETGLPQVDTRPAGAGSTHRTHLLTALTEIRHARTHDVFTTGGGLGLHAGNVYARTTTRPEPETNPTLLRLSRHRLVTWAATGWTATSFEHRDDAARALGVAGRLRGRVRRYRVDRMLWAWWQSELEWMSSPKRTKPSRRPSPTQLVLFNDGHNQFGRMPRTAGGRADFKTARAYVDEALTRSIPIIGITRQRDVGRARAVQVDAIAA